MTDLPHPWNEFLAELDEQLKEPVDLHCIGGFVCTYFYGLANLVKEKWHDKTLDLWIDIFEADPTGYRR
jgi:hypothetical protein